MENIIEVTNLTKRFKKLTAVNELNLSVQRGDVFGFLGPNGAGKSTTIRMLLSLIAPSGGNIKLFDKDLKQNRIDILRRIGAIIEKPDFYGYLTAYKNLEILGRLSGTDTSRKRIMELLGIVGLDQRANSKVKTFSHGMKQRLGLAQALLHNPELIILDEPTTGLDPQGMKEIRDLIIHLSKDQKKTVFLSSHILYEVELVASRMIIINKGTTVIQGSVNDLLNTDTLQVTFEVDNVEKTKSILSEMNNSARIDTETANKLILTMNKDEIPALNKACVERGIAVSAVIPTRSLEEYFLKLTTREGE